MSYREYFNIDPEYFPQVDKKLIEEKPDLWKKFWPHPTFVQLLKAMVDVLERKQKLSMWVDGAYGTGKSHAVFTLKKLIEASDEETTAYFEKYGLDNFLCKKLLNQKNEGKILVCHRYGSSDIQSDTDLIVAMQEGIEKALTEAGIENIANTSLKNSLIRFFENEENRQSFDIYAKGTYKTALGGDTSDSVLKKLREYDEEALRSLINKIFKVPAVRNGFSMNTGELCDWIREVIEKNNLKELVFIWDNIKKERILHHGGERYTFSPYSLVWDGDNYYIVGYSDKYQAIGSHRVDRIAACPCILDESAVPQPVGFDVSKYIKTTFRMYNAPRAEVELLCDNSVMDAIIDRFGPDVQTYAGDLQNFRVIEEIAVGKVFFNWIFGFEGKVRIKGPESVKKQYREMVMSAMNLV